MNRSYKTDYSFDKGHEADQLKEDALEESVSTLVESYLFVWGIC